MISPWGMRGKGMGFADRPAVPTVLRARGPWTDCAAQHPPRCIMGLGAIGKVRDARSVATP
jgi:hypothetical protein